MLRDVVKSIRQELLSLGADGRAVAVEQPRQRVQIHPDFIIRFLLRFVKNQLQPEMEVGRFNPVDILLVRVAGLPQVADDIARAHGLSLGQPLGEGVIPAQMGVIIIAPAVGRADADAPAAVLVPAERLDCAALDGNHGRADAAHQVMSQVPAFEAVGARRAEIIKVIVPIPLGKRGIGGQAVFDRPAVVLALLQMPADKTAQHGSCHIKVR